MHGRRCLAASALVAAFAIPAPHAAAQPLYGYDTASRLLTLDPATGARTPISTVDRQLGALTFDPETGTLYGHVSPGAPTDPDSIVTIDTATGATTKRPFQRQGSPPADQPLVAAATPGSGLYMLSPQGSPTPTTHAFGRIDESTWAHQPIGTSAMLGGYGFAASPAGALYAAGADNGPLVTVDPATGAHSEVTMLQGTGDRYVASMSFDQSGRLYAVLEQDSLSGSSLTLVEIDLATGSISQRGDLGDTYLIAFGSPDPPSGGGGGGGDGGGGGGPPASGPGPMPPSAQEVLTTLLGKLAPAGRRARIRRLLRAGGYRYPSLTSPVAGTLSLRWVTLKGKPVASGATLVAAGVATRPRIRLTPAGRQRLASARVLALRVTASFTAEGGDRGSGRKRFTVRR